MDPEMRSISEHMREFGCEVLGRAIYDCTFAGMVPYAHTMSITLAAHAAEILVKARIAQEHPLLIFETLPKSSSTTGLLSFGELMDYGKTLAYSDLPERLWAVTGYRMKELDRYKEFGKLRNQIMHFAAPEIDDADETLQFAFKVIDPMLEDFWDMSILPYTEPWDDVIVAEGYLQDRLERLEIKNLTTKTREYLNAHGTLSDE